LVFCDWYLSIIRPYLYSLLPENTINSGRFIVDSLYMQQAGSASSEFCFWNTLWHTDV
jgi:hypothetical protein